jgi:hypothetical protein
MARGTAALAIASALVLVAPGAATASQAWNTKYNCTYNIMWRSFATFEVDHYQNGFLQSSWYNSYLIWRSTTRAAGGAGNVGIYASMSIASRTAECVVPA